MEQAIMYQKRSIVFHYRIWLLLITVLLLSGCGNRFVEQLSGPHQRALSNVEYLKQQLDNKQLVNALLIDKYATQLSQSKPEYADIAALLRKEGTSQGKAYTGLTKRLAAVNLEPTSEQSANSSLNELSLIQAGADAYEFNSSLADVVNTLASLSDGELAVINVPASQQNTAQKSNALVGNPSYGNWKQDSSGRSFWEWYGMYSMFSNVFGGRNYYDSWSSRPSYSYYNNYGRNRWGSNTDISRNYNLSKRYPSKYNRPSTSTKQRYSTTSNRSSSYGGSSSRPSSKSTSSGYGGIFKNTRSSSSSSYGSSSRSSSYSSSRSSRSGK
jgi:hypothetical protein